MGIIFYFSAQPYNVSDGQSSFVLQLIKKLFFWAEPTSFIVRKAAHFTEYAGLCLLLNCSLLFSFGRIKPLTAFLFASLYAVTDEIHQFFVEGRSCQLTDWAVDTVGAFAGAAAFLAIYLILKKISEKRRIIK